jgi:Zn-dependent protease
VLLHELGHALTSRYYGIGVRGITLELLGGYTEMEREAPRPSAELTVSLAGPLVSLVLGLGAGAVAAVLPQGGIVRQLAFTVAVSNLIVAAFNALPGLPLDGGRALYAVVWAIGGDANRARQAAGWMGLLVAAGCAVAALALSAAGAISALGMVFLLLVTASIGHGAYSAVRSARAAARMRLIDLDRLVRPIVLVPSGTPLEQAQLWAASVGVPGSTVAVMDQSGTPVAVVDEAAMAAVPVPRRAYIAVDAVARRIDALRAIPAGLRGDDVIRAVQANPAAEYLVTSGRDVVGILRLDDLNRALDPRAGYLGRQAP